MSLLPSLEELDLDGAIRETAAKVDGNTRAAFLKKAGVGAGAVVGSSAFFGVLPSIASAGVAASDVAILNYALTLEYLEAEFYNQARLNKVANGDKDLQSFVNVVARDEAQHVDALKAALGTKAVAKPRFDFQDTVTNRKKFVATAQVLEDTGVAAYLGQLGNIKSQAVLAAAGSMMPVEARHAAWIRQIAGAAPAPAAFEVGLTKAKVLAVVAKTGFIVA
jgi:demethoxyubiquinone hydroxylase (CLK1/Coq7/Cat5 family)